MGTANILQLFAVPLSILDALLARRFGAEPRLEAPRVFPPPPPILPWNGRPDAQVGGLAEGWGVRARLGREFEAARFGLARLPAADGDRLIRVEHPFAGIARGGLPRIDGVEPVDRECHGHAHAIGIRESDGVL